MGKLGSEKRPVILRVPDEDRAREMAEICSENGWHFIIGFEPDQPEDISDLEKLLNPPVPISNPIKLGRNDPCFCGSGKKFKKCCIVA
jgi:SWIM/SEC-C metal-binding protein